MKYNLKDKIWVKSFNIDSTAVYIISTDIIQFTWNRSCANGKYKQFLTNNTRADWDRNGELIEISSEDKIVEPHVIELLTNYKDEDEVVCEALKGKTAGKEIKEELNMVECIC